MARNRTRRPVPATEAPAPVPAFDYGFDADKDAAKHAPRKSAVPSAYKRKYAKNALKGTCDDEFALRFADAAPKGSPTQVDELRAIAKANGIDFDARWGHVNKGMQRMNLSNVLRQRAKRGEAVFIGLWTNQPMADAA